MDSEHLKLLIPLASAMRLCSYHVEGWAGAVFRQPRGPSQAVITFITATNILANIAFLAWIILVAMRLGIAEALTVLILSMALGILFGSLTERAPGSPQALALAAIWPLTACLYIVVL